jgi:YVTN family beta-propeller protein
MSAGPYLYVPNEYDNTVSVIDTSSDTVVATIPVGGTFADTAAISPDGAFVYVASESGQVAVISTATNSVVTVIPVPGDLYTVAVSPDGSLVYAANVGKSAVSVIDARTNTLITNITVGGGPYGIAFSPDGTRAYVASESGTVSVISTATNSVLTTINVGLTPTMIAVSPDGSLVYVSNFGSGTVSVISTATNAIVDTITVGYEPYGVVFSPDGSRAYVATYDGMVVINTATDSVIASIDVGPSVGIAISPDGTHLYVTHYGYSYTVSVVDTATDSLVGTINVGRVPEYPAIGAPPPDNFAYEMTGPAGDLFGIVDLNTGVFTSVGSTGLTLAGLGSYGGIIYGAAYRGSTLYSVNTSTGALTAIGTGNIAYGGFGSTSSGLYAFGLNGDLYSINPANGAASDLGPTGLSFGGIVMGMSSGSSTLYLTQNNLLYSLNTTNGSATLIGTTNEGESGFGALFSVGGTLYGGAYGASTPDIYTLNPQSGTTTFVAASPSTPSAPGVAGFWGLAPFDTTIPMLTAVTESPSGSDLNGGKTVMITLTTSEAVTVTGAPTAMLNDGGTATYSSISADGKTLTFTYTVGSTDSNVTSLQVTSINLPNGATIQDGGGNNLNLSLSAVPTYSGPQIDTSTPTLSSVTANPSIGTAFANQVVTITVSFSEKVVVTGTPILSLNDGGGTATYQSGSGTNALVFSYSVSVGQYTSNLAVTAFNLPNGATVKDGGGNDANLNGATVTFSGLQISGSVADNWISSSSGNWTTVADWSSGVPNSNSDAVISKTGSYTITLSNADTAHSLSLNDTGAIVSDNTGGSLKLAGALAITNGTFQLAGGSLQAGTISIGGGGTFLIAKGTYTGSNALSETITDNGSLIDKTVATITGSISGTGTILAENKANLTIAGTLTGSEIFTIANTAHVLITSAVSGTGSFVIANSGVLEFGAADSENVTFASGASGTVKVDHSLTAPFTGTISGLTPKDTIDLADLSFVPGKMKATYDSSAGTLTVTNGTNSVSLKLAGNFTNATWVLSKDASGGTTVVDPPTNPNSSPASPGLDHVVALFNQHIAAGFPDHNGTPITNALSQIVTNEQQFLAQPHHG